MTPEGLITILALLFVAGCFALALGWHLTGLCLFIVVGIASITVPYLLTRNDS